MGISGLLPFLKDALVNVNVRQFEGQTVAIDTYCWIYRGAFGCAEDLAMGRPADGYVNKLLEWGIKPIMIFDGSCLPSKKGTELKRRESKDTYRKKAAQLLKEGRVNEARECFQRCIECTPKMALEVIQALHSIGVDVLVAPYEADAQLAYLNKANIAQLIITEDSDLILFGCEKILYKMDINGNAQLIEKQKIISVTQFDSADNFERFRWMCILSGCDYLENLPGIGLGKAKKLLKSIQKSDIDKILKQMPKILKMPNLVVSNEYIESFKKADNTFRYQIVFDPIKRKLVSLHPYSPDINENEDLTYAGIFYDDKLALQHSLGNIDVNSREVVYSFEPDKWKYKPPLKFINNPPAHMRSIWSETYTTMKNSTPFTNSAKPISLSYPMSKDRVKTISSKPLTEQLSNTMVKRKFESLDLDSQESISSSSCSSSRVPDEKENEADAKKSRLICASQNDVDQLVSQYSDSSYFAKKSSFKEETASVYFTSNQSSSKDSPSSPLVIKKPSQKFATLNKTEECKFILAVKKSPASPSRGENEDKNDDEECMSPIVVIEKSSQASSQVKSSTKLSMFARESSKSRRFLFEFGAEENTNEESKTKTTLTILDDLDKMDRKKVNENSAAKKPSSKAGKLANDPTPKITNFLAKYQHTSTNQFKLNK